MAGPVNNLRLLFSDITAGFSRAFFNSSPIYIKHLNNIDLAEIDYKYNFFLKDYTKKGIPTIEQKTDFLLKNALWDKKEEDRLYEFKKTKKTLQINKSNEYLRSKRQIWQNEIEKIDKEINFIENKKIFLIKDTAESAASKKTSYEYIKLTFYQDQELGKKLFNDQSFDELENEQISVLFDVFNEHTGNFNSENLKKIGLSPFFTNMFNLTHERINDLYGKPIVNLSVYQIEVWNWGLFFKNAIQQLGRTIPPEIQENPDDLMEYIEVNVLFKKMEEKMEDKEGAISLMGAQKSDLKMLGIETNQQFDLNEQLKKKGGKLSFEDMLKVHK